MLKTWLSRDCYQIAPRFLTDEEESTEQTSSVRQFSRLLLVWFLGPIFNTSVCSEFSSKKLFVIQFLYRLCKSIRFVKELQGVYEINERLMIN